MICELINVHGNITSVIGLALDFIGVSLLGYDLIKIQILQRKNAQDNRNELDHLAKEYGGISFWANDIKEKSRWVYAHEYSRHHAEDEVSYNARQAREQSADIANCVNGLGEHLASIIEIFDKSFDNEVSTANKSYIFSIVGVSLIAMGFILQIIGSWPCQ